MTSGFFIDVVAEVAGAGLVLFTLHEVFRDIFHPTRSGSLSDFVGRLGSRFLRKTSLRPALGPLILVAVIAIWALLLGAGFALIYLGLYPDYFTLPGGSAQTTFGERVLHSCYLSLGSLDTFQTFDIEPRSSWLKLVIGIEGLLGLAMITASVSWLVLLYPALSRNRFFAQRVSMLMEVQTQSGISMLDVGFPILSELAQELAQVRIDLVLFPVLLNFYPTDRSATLALVLPRLVELAQQGSRADLPATVRFGAAQLDATLTRFGQMLARRVLFQDERNREGIFRSFAELDD